MKKKSSLSLSMNAIVILILAITLLGLGLSFMRGLFKQMEIKTRAAIDAQELTNPPTSDNPITTAPGSITLRSGERGKILLAFMNVEPEDKYCQLTLLDDLGTAIDVTDQNADIVIYNYHYSSMAPDQINTWTLSVDTSVMTSVPSTEIATARICCQDVSAVPNDALGTVSCFRTTNDGVEFKKDIMINVIS